MKCALPGRYGKKVSIESSAILDSYYENDIDGKKQLSEDVGLSFDKIIKDDRTIEEIHRGQSVNSNLSMIRLK